MKTYRIRNCGEGVSKIYKELTDEQFNFLENLFDEINDSFYNEQYAPSLYIEEVVNN